MHNKFEPDVKLDFCDVLILPKSTSVSSRKEVNLEVPLNFRKAGFSLPCVPVCASNMDGVGTISMGNKLASYKMITTLTKYTTAGVFEKEDYKKSDYVFGTFGLDDYSKSLILNENIENYFSTICLDVANGYMGKFLDFVSLVRERWPHIGILAGNVVTPEGVIDTARAGADFVKVGIGSGSVCTTRRVAGIGYPQLSALLDCRIAAEESECGIVSDGGCVHPGDVSKAFAAGAEIVLLGGMLAGHDEGADDAVVIDDGEKRRFIFSGSSSSRALKKIGNNSKYRTSEGRVVLMEAKGSVEETVNHILGGLRSTCSYTNCFDLKDLYMNSKFIRVNRQLNEYFEHHTIGV
jgi:GMP reductase